MDLAGKHAVVTGAANGIGRALAERFHLAGASVVVADVDAEGVATVAASLEAVRADPALGVTAVFCTEQGNIELIRSAEARFGAVDLFFANAGVGVGTDLDTPEAVW